MIKSALEFLMNAGKTEVIEIGGQKYVTKNVNMVKSPQISSLEMSTLTGLVDYIKANVDMIDELKNIFVHVRSEREVSILSVLKADVTRDCLINCIAKTPKIVLDTYLDTEKFNVMLQSCFLDVGDRQKVLNLVGNIKEENVKNTSDNGIAQTIVARAGVATVDYVDVPNPVMLAPFRTFIEIEQPFSKFVLRLKDGPQVGLFEADGGEWRLASMLRIKKYLQEALPGIDILA